MAPTPADPRPSPTSVLAQAVGWVLPDRRLPFPTVWYREAWRLFWRDWPLWIGFTLQFAAALILLWGLGLGLLIGMGLSVPRLYGWISNTTLAGAGLLAMGGGLVLLGAILALFVVPGALQGALPWLMLRRLRHQEPLRLAALLKASDAGILAGVIYSLIFGVLTILVAQLGLIYGLFLTVPYSIGLYRMADGERSALRAFGAGLRVLRSHLLGHVAFAAIALVLQTMSYCTLGLALMITVPLQMLACALLYLAHEERGMFTVSESPEGAPPGPG